jgi:O-methyltransferase
MKLPRSVTGQVTTDELLIIKRELLACLKPGIAGDVVELGCFEGGSAVFMQSILVETQPDKKLWLYDSFEGLPEKTAEDKSPLGKEFIAGELHASKARLERNFHKANVPLPEIRKAWFYELQPHDLPEQICFAFLDGDFYESIMDSLSLIWPKLSKGACVVIDDYQNPKLPGVQKAVDEWAKVHDFMLKVEKSLAIISV